MFVKYHDLAHAKVLASCFIEHMRVLQQACIPVLPMVFRSSANGEAVCRGSDAKRHNSVAPLFGFTQYKESSAPTGAGETGEQGSPGCRGLVSCDHHCLHVSGDYAWRKIIIIL